ncbi:MAG: hypothetical protein J7K54_03210 [Candidatus Aenigmarchaeota archaeon]|nr:hypothetical protein [Candidatus Aenigmarchaeota archaeon]
MRYKKGQIVFEFVIASLIVFAVIFYTIAFVSGDFNSRHVRYSSDRLEENAVRVTEMLAGSTGNGIFSEWPKLDTVKMQDFQSMCTTDYIGLLDNLSLREESPYISYIHMNLTVSDGTTTYINCGRTPPEGEGKAVINRYGLSPANKIARISLFLW